MSSPMDVSDAKSSNVQVVLRCRPSTESERRSADLGYISLQSEDNEVNINAPVKGKNTRKTYTFDTVFGPGSTQEDVYHQTVRPLVEEVLAGFNCTVFAYGQTGTGKTYTMEGHLTSNIRSKDAGVIPRSVHTIFDQLERQGVESSVKVSFLEIYNEELTDLLAEEGDPSEHRELRIFEDSTGKRGILVNNLEEVLVSNSAEVFALLQKSWQKRRTAETLLNKNSSRSHCVFIITVHTKESDEEGEDIIKTGKLYLVDLAGSECVGKSGAQNARAKEAGNINKSLLTLGRVINSLVDKSSYVPYRDSKLTRLLQESLGGRAKTVIIATISPAASALDETVSTLDYAHRAKHIKNRPQVNQKISKRAYMRELESEINQLKAQNDALRLKNGVYLPPAQYEEMVQQIKSDAARLEESAMLLASKEAEYKELSEMLNSKEAEYRELEAEKRGVETELATTQDHLITTRSELVTTHVQLVRTADELMQTQHHLHVTEVKLDETSYLVHEHERTESELHEQAHGVVRQLEGVLDEKERLHDKIDEMASIELHNWQATENVQVDVRDGVHAARQVVDQLHDEQQQRFREMTSSAKSMTDAHAAFHTEARAHVSAFASTETDAHDAMTRDVTVFEERAVEASDAFHHALDEHHARVDTHVTRANDVSSSGLRTARTSIESLQVDTLAQTARILAASEEATSHTETFISAASTSLQSLAQTSTAFGDAHLSALGARRSAVEQFLQRQQAESDKLTESLLRNVQTLIQDYRREHEQSLHDSLSLLMRDLQSDMRRVEEWSSDVSTQAGALSTQLSEYRTQSAAMGASRNQLLHAVDTSVERRSSTLVSELAALSQTIGEKYAELQQLADAQRDDGHCRLVASRTHSQTFAQQQLAQLADAQQRRAQFVEQHHARAQSAHHAITVYAQHTQQALHELAASTTQASGQHRQRVEHVEQRMNVFVNSEIKHDQPSGRTPIKVKPLYRTEFVRTRPHTELLTAYRLSKKRPCDEDEMVDAAGAAAATSSDEFVALASRGVSTEAVHLQMAVDDDDAAVPSVVGGSGIASSNTNNSSSAIVRPRSAIVSRSSNAPVSSRPGSAASKSSSSSSFSSWSSSMDRDSQPASAHSVHSASSADASLRRSSGSHSTHVRSDSSSPHAAATSPTLPNVSSMSLDSSVDGVLRGATTATTTTATVNAMDDGVSAHGARAAQSAHPVQQRSTSLLPLAASLSSSSSSTAANAQSNSKKVKRSNSSVSASAAAAGAAAGSTADDENAPPASSNLFAAALLSAAAASNGSVSSAASAAAAAAAATNASAAAIAPALLADAHALTPAGLVSAVHAFASVQKPSAAAIASAFGEPTPVQQQPSTDAGVQAASSSSAVSSLPSLGSLGSSSNRTRTLKPGMRLHFGSSSIPVFGGASASAVAGTASSVVSSSSTASQDARPASPAS